ncbi:hypothetical protein K470DRAFT_225603 [Piedraia hortae CBS 480.64]|uniref:Peroxisomal membrane protein PEX14 n=1 Tax=Piedraia hortae CBS 480.64 TaxID=1314780 RepID=A0A6A7C8F1_9PEZI|nr:hypothetical protein K470DRAFT_225603 [Piedraia hortae CBS 480.64]
MVRESLVEGAVTFLRDPSVASAPLESRIAFLKSKNLTQEEIDASLARVGSQPSSTAAAPPPGYPLPQYGYWEQAPPMRRDWRDWFIMATVVGGMGATAYWAAKRYIYPLIAPPTPPQLEQDKAHVDEAFNKTFALLDQLAKDTQELKDAEKARTDRLDSALAEVENVVSRMKEAHEAREAEAKRMARDVADIKDSIPNAIEKDKKITDTKIQELTDEMKSLKLLIQARMQQPSKPDEQQQKQANGTSDTGIETPLGSAGRSMVGGRVSIPAWQLAAKKKAEEPEGEAKS